MIKGWRPDIYQVLSNVRKQVDGYHDPLWKSFDTFTEARTFMDENCEYPPGVNTPFPLTPETSLSPLVFIYPEVEAEATEVSEVRQFR